MIRSSRMKNPCRIVLCLLGVGLLMFLASSTKYRYLFKEVDYEILTLRPNGGAHAAALAPKATKKPNVPVFETLEEALRVKHKVDPKTGAKIIVMSSLDSGYIEMGLNRWESSFLKFDIQNYLFVCTDKYACLELVKRGLSCVQGKEDKDAGKSSDWGTAAFNRKTNLKTEMTLQVLRLGYTILLVDVDIVFLKNPFPYFVCDDCDIHVQSDGVEINSGFVFVKPNQRCIDLYEMALKMAQRTKLVDQKSIARTMEKMRREKTIKVKILTDKEFPRGEVFFEHGRRMFATDPQCEACVIVHNNWIVSGEAKRYRFKEFLFWHVDTHAYYTSPDRRYLTYHNPFDFGPKNTTAKEIEALKTALRIGFLLNRTVILPGFHCYGCKYGACRNKAQTCSLNTHIDLEKMDAHLNGHYREHVFLNHHKVPDRVRDSRSDVILVGSDVAISNKRVNESQRIPVDIIFTPENGTKGTTPDILLYWLAPYQQYSILQFHSLYDALYNFSNVNAKTSEFEKILTKAIIKSGYRQYK